MKRDHILEAIAAIDAHIAQLQTARDALAELQSRPRPAGRVKTAAKRGGSRHMSEAGRKAIGRAQKARWAELRRLKAAEAAKKR
jgi:hypothetical protein